MARVDLTVRGGGIFGLSIAWEAVRRGARVRLIEALAIGAGSSGGLVGALAPHVPENWNAKKQFQLESLLASEDFFASASAASDLPTGYGRTGRLQPIADDAALALARQRGETARDLWLDQAIWQVIPAAAAPLGPVSPSGYLIHDTLSARLDPGRTLAALAAAITAMGGEVILGEAQTRGPVIWATGVAGIKELSQALGRSLGSGVKGQAATLQFAAAGAPQLFIDTLHVVPHDDGRVAIGSTSETQWQHASSTDAHLDALIARARAALPDLQDAPVVGRWAGVRPRTVTRAPLLGAWPGRPGHFIANGGFKIGFGMAAKVAQVMVDLVLEGRDAIPPDFGTGAL